MHTPTVKEMGNYLEELNSRKSNLNKTFEVGIHAPKSKAMGNYLEELYLEKKNNNLIKPSDIV